MKHCAVSSLKHIALLPWRATLNLNERILKLWKSTCPFGIKVDEINFFTGSERLREEALRRNIEEYKRINPGIDDADNLAHDLRKLMEKKLQMFPNVKKVIIDASIEPISDTKYRILVASTDHPEHLKQILTKTSSWRE